MRAYTITLSWLNPCRCPLPDVLPKAYQIDVSCHAAAKQEEEELNAQKKQSSSQSSSSQKQQGGETPPTSSSQQPRAALTSSSAAGSISLASWSHQGIAEKAKEVLLATVALSHLSYSLFIGLLPCDTFPCLFIPVCHWIALIGPGCICGKCTLSVCILLRGCCSSTS